LLASDSIIVCFSMRTDLMVQPNPVSRSEEHMLGHGFYNKHSHEQRKANAFTLPLIAEAINQINLDQIGDEFRIADHGSAQGQNSLLPMKTAIAQIKELAAKHRRIAIPISITHTDLPTNDWATLFQTILFSPDSYLADERNIFCFGSGTSIYGKFFLRTTSHSAIRPSPNTG
jgi:SAM dependent carboxyl methyltransferase